jgi:fructose PTS system EIIBC or EIIC component
LETITAPAPDPDGAGTVPAATTDSASRTGPPTTPHEEGPAGVRIRDALMSGVSYAIPFVVAGGLLIALGYGLGGHRIAAAQPVTDAFDWSSSASWAALFFQLGTLTFGLLVPVLSGYIAHAMADRPALVPGFVGGTVAVQAGAGFVGGLVAGVLAGAVVRLLGRWRPPTAVAGVRPVLVLPLLGTIVTGAVMFLVVGPPLAALGAALTAGLDGLSGSGIVLLGAGLGLMMAVDLGGPVNKTAFTFAVTGLSTGSPTASTIMAAVLAAGMTPPLAMALASTLRSRRFTDAERRHGRAAWLLGATYVTEGAIPFAASDPLRVVPSLMAGSATAGAVSVAMSASTATPHGGIFVLPLVGHPLGLVVAITAGMLVSATAVVALKAIPRRHTVPAHADGSPPEEPNA